MARRKLKPPTSRRRSGGGRRINVGWWGTIGAILLLGVTGVIFSRGSTSSSDIVHEVTMPDIGGAERVSVVEVMVEPFDRVEEGQALYEIQSGETKRTLEAPVDGTVGEVLAGPGDQVTPGTRIATVQTGPDFNPGNTAGNHWHSAYGVNVCGEWLGALGQFDSDFHTHGDGLIHAHPRSTSAAGTNATLGLFLDRAGGSISLSKLEYGNETYENGKTTCGEGDDERDAVLRWAVNGEEQDGNPGQWVVGNGDVVVIAFLPEDEEMPTEPPSVSQLASDYAPPNLPGFQAPDEGAEAPTGEGDAPAEGEGEGETPEGETTTTVATEPTTTTAGGPTTTSGGSSGS